MIKKLKRRFIGSATAAVLLVMTVILLLINVSNYYRNIHEAHLVLNYLTQSGGTLPDFAEKGDQSGGTSVEVITADGDQESGGSVIRRGLSIIADNILLVLQRDHHIQMSRDSLLQTRFFTVWTGSDGQITQTNRSYIAEVSEENARKFASMVLKKGSSRGSIVSGFATYEYQISRYEDGSTMTVFLDASNYHDSVRSVLILSIIGSGVLAFLIIALLVAFSRRAVDPMIRNYEAQKQFITNAGHELKTPIAIISANAELLEMMRGENEWTQSIRKQSARLSDLVADLITLTRMGEQERIKLHDIDLSTVVTDAAESYRPVVEQQHKALVLKVNPAVHVHAEEKLAKELVNILVDNAAKYCDDEGRIVVSLRRRNRVGGAHLVVENTYAQGANVDYNRFFDRFYREDSSHSSEREGYGIGLSMAQGIVVDQFRGSIRADYKDGNIRFIVRI